MNKPNFFIIGFPKCGTTSLANYLSEHSDILFSKIKEPHYFSSDFTDPVLRRACSEEAYLDLFADDRHDWRAIGEASTGYIFSKVAIENILRFTEKPKIIVVLRNPMELVFSEHAQMLRSGHEDIDDFYEAWKLSNDRMKGEMLPQKKTANILVSYKEFGRVGSYLDAVIKKVGRENLHLIVFDDMQNDIRSVYKRLLSFIDVPDDERIEFDVWNTRRFHRYNLLARFINDPPEKLLALNDLIKKTIGINEIGFINWLRTKNLRKKEIITSDCVLTEIRASFDEEIRLVESLLSRKLTW